MMQAEDVKAIFTRLGADICGIAPAERFAGAPIGFHPRDIYESCESVVVFARKEPAGILAAKSCAAYTHVNMLQVLETDLLGLQAAREIERLGCKTVAIPTDDPYEHWEPEKMRGMGILSLRHAGWLAGLGKLGKNTLLVNRDLGNMMQLGALLLDVELEPDPMADYEACSQCDICIEACPEGALDGETVDQKLCRPRSIQVNEKGYTLYKCNLCRAQCPNALYLSS
jgi:epoxyqueuosine reductase